VVVVYLGKEGLVGAMIQQNDSNVFMTFLGGDVQSGAEVFGRGVWLSSMLQQQSHVVNVAKSRRDVQCCLLLLHTHTFTYVC